MEIQFLTVDEIIKMHKVQILTFGGQMGIRDKGLLQSAINSAQSYFSGQYLHPDVYHMAAAYMYNLVKNHAFIDGNKRIGALAALTFLDLNNIHIDLTQDDVFNLAMAAAQSKISLEVLAALFKKAALK